MHHLLLKLHFIRGEPPPPLNGPPPRPFPTVPPSKDILDPALVAAVQYNLIQETGDGFPRHRLTVLMFNMDNQNAIGSQKLFQSRFIYRDVPCCCLS